MNTVIVLPCRRLYKHFQISSEWKTSRILCVCLSFAGDEGRERSPGQHLGWSACLRCADLRPCQGGKPPAVQPAVSHPQPGLLTEEVTQGRSTQDKRVEDHPPGGARQGCALLVGSFDWGAVCDGQAVAAFVLVCPACVLVADCCCVGVLCVGFCLQTAGYVTAGFKQKGVLLRVLQAASCCRGWKGFQKWCGVLKAYLPALPPKLHAIVMLDVWAHQPLDCGL